LWHHRNGVVHGATVDEQVQPRLSHLRDQITQHYATFSENPNYLLARHHRLFTSRPVEERINTLYDAMAAWLRSVEEALQVVQHHDDRLREASQAFFGRPNPAEEVSDSDSSYSVSHQSADEETTSINPTEATTVTYNTLSSKASSASGSDYLHYDSDGDSISMTKTAASLCPLIFPSVDLGDDSSIAADGPRDADSSSVTYSTINISSNGWDVH
jgi:hypothetical protein